MLKMYQELEHTFSVVSLGTEVFKIGEAGGGSGLVSSAFQTLPSGVHKIGVDFHTLKKFFCTYSLTQKYSYMFWPNFPKYSRLSDLDARAGHGRTNIFYKLVFWAQKNPKINISNERSKYIFIRSRYTFSIHTTIYVRK